MQVFAYTCPKNGRWLFKLPSIPASSPPSFMRNLAFFASPMLKKIMDKKIIDHEIKYIVDQIVSKYAPDKIILFGSAARGDYDHLNDLDFMVIKHDVPTIGINRLRELDSLIDRNMAVDLLVYRPDEIEERKKLGDPFILNIMAEGRVLYG